MKISSRIFVMLFLLLGVAFVVIFRGAYAAGNEKCQSNVELRFGIDPDGCENKTEPVVATKEQMLEWLKHAGVGEQCYRIKIWKEHEKIDEIGKLELLPCPNKSIEPKWNTMQPHGSGGTQRVMFNTGTAKEAFEKQIKGANP
jgi:hypothetical protein